MSDRFVSPLVSVIIPCYNCAKYLPESVESILNQTYDNIEIIVVDDGSVDETNALCQVWQRLNGNFKYIKKLNGGIASALNEGIRVSNGSYIARLDADDVAFSNRIALQVDFLERNLWADLISTAYIPFDDQSKMYLPVVHPSDPDIIKILLCYCSPICHPGVMVRASILHSYKYRVDVSAEDHELWCRIALEHNLTNTVEPLLLYRRHPESLSVQKLRKIRGDTLRNGFKYFLNNYSEISKIKWCAILEHHKKYPHLRWELAYLYKLLSVLFRYVLYHA